MTEPHFPPTGQDPTAPIVTAGVRHDLEDFFAKSGLWSSRQLEWPHHPVLAVTRGEGSDDVLVRVYRTQQDVLALPSNTFLLQQWPGQYRSDFFGFHVRDVRAYLGLPHGE